MFSPADPTCPCRHLTWFSHQQYEHLETDELSQALPQTGGNVKINASVTQKAGGEKPRGKYKLLQ